MKKRKKSNMPLCFIVTVFVFTLISCLFSIPVVAQEEEAGGNREQETMKLEAITVTAQKQEENIQEVPMSVSAMTDGHVEDRKIESVQDIADFVPNLMVFQVADSGNNVPVMRGINAPPESFRVSTGLYVDGVPELTGIGFEDGMLDIQRIEVLRGPQGTIYGKGAEAGAIKIITRSPDNEFKGKMSLEVGEDEKKQISLSVSGPIQKDKLYYSLSGLFYSKDGFIENTTTDEMINDKNHWLGKALIRWTPTDVMDISFAVSRLEYDEGEPDMQLGEGGASSFSLPSPLDRQVSSNVDGWNKSSRDSQHVKIAYELNDSLVLTSITTNRKYHQHTLNDWDGTSQTIMHALKDNEYATLSEELRLNYTNGQIKGLVGLYYDQENTDIRVNEVYYSGYYTVNTNREYEGETLAAFANLSYPLTTQLSLITGLRYETEKKDFIDNNTQTTADDSWDQLTPKLAVEFNVTPKNIAYVSFSQGYRSGGFNVLAVSNPDYLTYDSETLWSYEIGSKNVFLNNKLIINGAVYYMDIKNMQVNEQASANETYLTNAAAATGIGMELEMTAHILNELTLDASYGYNNTEFDDFSDIRGNYKGNKNPFAPEYTYHFGSQYRHAGGIYARADLVGYSKIYFDKANKYSRDAYEVVNIKIGYETDACDVYFYAENLFDKEYNSDEYYESFITIYSPPREMGLKLAYRF